MVTKKLVPCEELRTLIATIGASHVRKSVKTFFLQNSKLSVIDRLYSLPDQSASFQMLARSNTACQRWNDVGKHVQRTDAKWQMKWGSKSGDEIVRWDWRVTENLVTSSDETIEKVSTSAKQSLAGFRVLCPGESNFRIGPEYRTCFHNLKLQEDDMKVAYLKFKLSLCLKVEMKTNLFDYRLLTSLLISLSF